MGSKIYKPPGYKYLGVLLDGSKVLIRPVCYSDQNGIQCLHERLTPLTRYLRFHYTKGDLTPEELETFCSVDYRDCFGLVAELHRIKKTDIVGVGRYNRIPGTTMAEIAFVVEDKEQGKGIGTHLLKALARIAYQQGIEEFIAEMLADNVVMMDILRKYNPDLSVNSEGSSRHVRLKVIDYIC